MGSHQTFRLVALAAAVFAGPAAADETKLGATVGGILITKPITKANLSLANRAAIKTVAARDLQVSGPDPVFTVSGQVFCKNGARLVAAQAIVGNLVLNNGQLVTLGSLAESPKQTSIAGRSAADVSLVVKLPVTRTVGQSAVDLTFNPARTFETRLKAFTQNGGSAAAYLQGDEAFDIPVSVNLVGWCKMPGNVNSVLAGKTYAGFAARSVPVTILYTGDPRITDGAGVRATSGAGDLLSRPEAPPPQPPARQVAVPAPSSSPQRAR